MYDVRADLRRCLLLLARVAGSDDDFEWYPTTERPLLDALDRDIFVVGTEFYQQTLFDKQVDIVASNLRRLNVEFSRPSA